MRTHFPNTPSTLVLLTLCAVQFLNQSPRALGQLFTPTVQHKAMAREVGTWNAVVKFWMSPEGQPQENRGTETVTMLGDLWAIAEFKGTVEGAEFVGRSQLGYDPVKKKYIGTWIDTMSPYMYSMEGTYDVKTHTLTMMSTGINPVLGKEIMTKNVTRYVDNNTKVFEVFLPVEGQPDKWWRQMEIRYARKAPE